MGYLTVWKVLDEMIADFRRRGITTPIEVINDLKSAKTMAEISKVDICNGEVIQKIEEYVMKVESYLVPEAQKSFGDEYMNTWLQKLERANKTLDGEQEKTRFFLGIPRDKKWIRIKPSTELPEEKLKIVAREVGVSAIQNEDLFLVCGKEENIKEFVRRMTTEGKSEAKK